MERAIVQKASPGRVGCGLERAFSLQRVAIQAFWTLPRLLALVVVLEACMCAYSPATASAIALPDKKGIDGSVEVVNDPSSQQDGLGRPGDGAATTSVHKTVVGQVGVVTSNDGAARDNFGWSIAVSGDTAIVGAPGADIGSAVDQGAVYVFVRTNSGWVQQQKLTASDEAGGAQFGSSVALDGDTALVGINNSDMQGVVYVFVRTGTQWNEQQKLIASDGASTDRFGWSIALNKERALIGAPLADINSVMDQGAAYAFVRSNGVWREQQKLVAADGIASDGFGWSVAVQGNTAIVGAPTLLNGGSRDAAYVFAQPETQWNQQQRLTPKDGATYRIFGESVALDGSTAIVGARGSGMVFDQDQGSGYVFVRTANTWTQQQKFAASDGEPGDDFGGSVALSGTTILAAANSVSVEGRSGQGSAYLLERTSTGWNELQKLTSDLSIASGHFGWRVALDGDVGFVAAPFFRVNNNTEQGVVYLYERVRPRLAKFYSPSVIATESAAPVSVSVVLTTAHGLASVVLTETIPSGFELMPGSLNSVPQGAAVEAGNPRRILWRGTLASAAPLTLQYQMRLLPTVQPGTVLGSEVIATTGTGDNYIAQSSIAVQDGAFRGALNLIYIAADTASTGLNTGQGDLSGGAVRLINQAELTADTPNVRTIVMLDGPEPNDARIYNLHADTDLSCPNYNNPLCAGHSSAYVEGKNTFAWGDSVANPNSLAEFVIGAVHANPAAQTILLSLVGHGGGWSPEVLKGQPTKYGGQPTSRTGQPDDALSELGGGLLWDVNYSDALSTQDLATALRLVQSATGKKVDLLYLDACLMAMSEVAYEIRDGANYLLASESWSWTTFPYDEHIAAAGRIMGGSNPALLKTRKIGEAWLANEVDVLSEEDNYPFTFSLIDLSNMSALTAAQNQLANSLLAAFDVNTSQTRNRLDTAFAATECVDSSMSARIEHDSVIGWADNYCDLGTFATAIIQQFGDNLQVINAAQTVLNTLATTIHANEFRSGVPHTYSELPWRWRELHGLTIYLPLRQDQWKRRYYNALFLPSSVDSQWGALLARYWDAPLPDPELHPDPDCTSETCSLPPAALPAIGIRAEAVSTFGGIRINWWVKGNSPAIASFSVQRFLPHQNQLMPLGAISNPSPLVAQTFAYIDLTAVNNYEFCYRVVGLGSEKVQLVQSNMVCAATSIGVAVVQAPKLSPVNTGILVEWGDSQSLTSDERYRLYRSANRGVFVPINPKPVSDVQYVDEAVVPKVEYCYMLHILGRNWELLGQSDLACTSLDGSPQYLYMPKLIRQ